MLPRFATNYLLDPLDLLKEIIEGKEKNSLQGAVFHIQFDFPEYIAFRDPALGDFGSARQVLYYKPLEEDERMAIFRELALEQKLSKIY